MPPDPLDGISDPKRRSTLAEIRDLDGQLLSSSRLRSLLPGFKGQKGIYKPSGSPYALWVRQTLRAVYPDKSVTASPDGSWVYDYSPEGRAGRIDMGLDTNRALIKCMADRVPVGVLRQVIDREGNRAYEVRGLGYVTGFDGVHFRIVSEPIDVTSRPALPGATFQFEPFDRTLPHIAPALRRIRDMRFRLAIRRLYHERCSLCNLGYYVKATPVAVEAAHIIPVDQHGTSRDVRNGLLLCSNHHALFDSFAWTFDEDLRVHVTPDPAFHESAVGNHVLKAEGRRLENLPDSVDEYPASDAIRFRWGLFSRNQ
jgi:hypothetical protein